MKSYLLIGDPHVKRTEIEEMTKFITWVKSLCLKYKAIPVFMGDQYNEMGLVRVEVSEFWNWAFRELAQSFALEGNHDVNADGTSSAMAVHQDVTKWINKGGGVIDRDLGIYGIGFTRDNDAFIKHAHAAAAQGFKTILCHAEFEGSQYENGFYAPNGIKIDLLPGGVQFISGHIHKQQSFGPIWYPGTGRQLTRSDIGEIKGVWVWTPEKNETIFCATPKEVCEPFTHITITPDMTEVDIPDSPKTYVDIKGPKDFVQKVAKKMPESVRVKIFPDQDRKIIEIKESDGIPHAFAKYAEQYFVTKQVPADMQAKILTSIYSKCPSLKSGVVSGNKGA